jgi:hypothetical protein
MDRTHYARLNSGINYRLDQPVVTRLRRSLSQRDNFRMRSWITIGARSISSNCQHRFFEDDTSADRNLAALLCFKGCGDCLAHPMRIQFSFAGSGHDGNKGVKQRKI